MRLRHSREVEDPPRPATSDLRQGGNPYFLGMGLVVDNAQIEPARCLSRGANRNAASVKMQETNR